MKFKSLSTILLAWLVGASALQGAAISSATYTLVGKILTITVSTETYVAANLVTGQSVQEIASPLFALQGVGAIDNLELATAAGRGSTSSAFRTTNFNGGLFQDVNGAGYDFFVFERSGNDLLRVQAIFSNDSLGMPVDIALANGSGWGPTGFFDDQVAAGGGAPQEAKGAAFRITDLKDAGGANLTNSSVIKGLRFDTGSLDPSVVVAVVPEPSAVGLVGLGLLCLAARRSRNLCWAD